MSVLRIKQANCKNCYKCVRVCPVKAIKIKDGQATVDEERCILCGQCWLACPQHAKEVVSDLPVVTNLLRGSSPVYVSLAPSLAAAWPNASPGQLVSALQQLGFAGVSQTAAGAAVVSRGYQELLKARGEKPWLATACPAFVSLAEKYYPDAVSQLAPLPSPLMVHARMLKERYPAARLVFIGPCLAKKAEAARPEYAGLVDAVLLASELAQWLEAAAIRPEQLEEKPWLELDAQAAVLYPLHGGLLRYLQLEGHTASAVAGTSELQELLQGLQREQLLTDLVECNICHGGCLNGPDMPRIESSLLRQQRLQQYAAESSPHLPPVAEDMLPVLPAGLFAIDYHPRALEQPVYTEDQIRGVLHGIGKHSPADELNCGACGYASCRKKAQAVLAGMAEPEMCMPFMRSQAESLANLVIQSTPNALIVVDQNLQIREFNQAAERLWLQSAAAVKGQALATVIPDDDFRQVQHSRAPIHGKIVTYDDLGLITAQTILNLADDTGLTMGVVTDITVMQRQAEELSTVKAETVRKAQEVIDKQMRVAQEIAGLLGEVTADSKMLLLRLIKLVQGEGGPR